MKRFTAILIAFLALCHAGVSLADDCLMFSYFTGNGEDGLHLAYSDDGLTWNEINNGLSFVPPVLGNERLMRDPCIITGPDGLFHMVWTVSWNDRLIGYASSPDLIHWSRQKAIPVMAHEPEALNCWAPEIFHDDETNRFIIYWSTTITGEYTETALPSRTKYNHRMYYTATKDFVTFEPTRLFLDPGFNCIDGTIVMDGDRYVMFFKDETLEPPAKNILITTADHVDGPWSAPSTPITGDYWAEGPTAAKIGDWRYVYFDKYRKHAYGAVRSRDLTTWEDVSDSVSFPDGVRHGTVFRTNRATLDRLLSIPGGKSLDGYLESIHITKREIVYKTASDAALTLHLFEPETREPNERRPAIVFFFGGGWTNGTPAQFFPFCKYLAMRGMVAISAEYRVASRHGTPPAACVADGKSAVRWIREHSAELGIDPHHIAAGGGSAGGHVASTTALVTGCDDDSGNTSVSARPDALVLFNPVADTTDKRWQKRFGNDAVRLSPLHNVRMGLPPTLIFHGVEDTTVPLAGIETFAKAMEEANNSCEVMTFEGAAHGFFNYGRGNNEAFIETTRAMDRFLCKHGFLRGNPKL